MATRVPALIQLSDPRVAAQLVSTMARHIQDHSFGDSASHLIYTTIGQFRGDGRTVRTLVFGVYKICCITGSYLLVIHKDITL